MACTIYYNMWHHIQGCKKYLYAQFFLKPLRIFLKIGTEVYMNTRNQWYQFSWQVSRVFNVMTHFLCNLFLWSTLIKPVLKYDKLALLWTRNKISFRKEFDLYKCNWTCPIQKWHWKLCSVYRFFSRI